MTCPMSEEIVSLVYDQLSQGVYIKISLQQLARQPESVIDVPY
jgi:hypothetical protein